MSLIGNHRSVPAPSQSAVPVPGDAKVLATTTVFLGTLLALGVRLVIVHTAHFPLNDGGLFYSFIEDLLYNGLRLPAASTYNGASIPLAYPPLAFYMVAFISSALHVPALTLLQYLPAILSGGSIPAFYYLAIEVVDSRWQAALATLVFAFIPRTFDWLIMGGGITRSLGLLFALLLMRQTYRLFAKRSTSAAIWAIVLGGLLVYSHPEAATHGALTAALLYFWHDRSRAGLRNAALVAVGVLVITVPWWGVVLARDGLSPFIAVARAARQDSYGFLASLLALFRFDFTDEPFLKIFAVLALLGLAIQLSRKEYFLSVWLVLLHLLEPRGATLFMMIPLAMAAGFCLEQVIFPACVAARTLSQPGTKDPREPAKRGMLGSLRFEAPRIFVIYLALYGALASYVVGLRIVQDYTLTTDDARAFEWVREHTPKDSRFALVTEGLPLRDPVSEWFPALAKRTSVATVFGLEWVRSADFGAHIRQYEQLQTCAFENLQCLSSWATASGETFEYIYLRPPSIGRRMVLQESLAQDPGAELVFSNSSVEIYRHR